MSRSTAAERLRNVYWIGGGSGAGKTTIAKRLADRYGLRHVSTDATIADHGRRTPPEKRPLASAFAAMDMNERWVDRTPEIMFETFHFFRGECFDQIVEDLLELPRDQRVVIEGFRLLPRLVKPLLHAAHQGVWLLPTPEFRRAAFESRDGLWEIAGKTSNPERALQNLLARDALFTDCLRNETRNAGLPAIEVNTSVNAKSVLDQVVERFRL